LLILLTTRNLDVICWDGLAGGSASATLAELGYNVKSFCFQDSPRRASIAAQGGINAAKNQGDGDSVFRLFYETVKEEIIVHVNQTYIVAEVSANIIDQCVSREFLWHVSMEGYWTIVLWRYACF
jgi:succinate dehydrogenase / fumarate reductase flavoprotein subunit